MANKVFRESIISAAIAADKPAEVPELENFELMVQSWMLRVGHYELTQTYTAFLQH